MSWFSLFVVIHALLVTLLAMNVSRLRMTLKIANGDGDDKRMRRAIRAHANAVEHVLIFGLVMAAIALEQVAGAAQATLVCGFALSRLLHAYGMLAPRFRFRQVGAGICYLIELAGIVVLGAALF